MKKRIFILVIMFLVLITGCSFNNDTKIKEIKVDINTTDDAKHYMTIKALDKNDNIKWTYETEKVYVAQFENLEYFKTRNNIVYINCDGTIIALDYKTGKKLWENKDYKGSSSKYTVDELDNLYLTSAISPILFIIDEHGKTVNSIKEYTNDIKAFIEPSDIKIEGDKYIKVIYPSNIESSNNEIIFYIDELFNTKNNILNKIVTPVFEEYKIENFDNIKKFQLTQDGSVFAYVRSEEENKKNIQTKIKIMDDVKNIYPVLVGSNGKGQLIMLKQDGSVSFISKVDLTLEEQDVKELDVENINNLVILKLTDGINYYLIDKDGNIIDEFNVKE